MGGEWRDRGVEVNGAEQCLFSVTRTVILRANVPSSFLFSFASVLLRAAQECCILHTAPSACLLPHPICHRYRPFPPFPHPQVVKFKNKTRPTQGIVRLIQSQGRSSPTPGPPGPS
eukprot:scaffold544_cov117-Isochrysis_galbana.AAC.8